MSVIESNRIGGERDFCAQAQNISSAPILTTYKKDVDIYYNPIQHYGLTQSDYKLVEQKLVKQRTYLKSHFVYHVLARKRIPLEELVVSANHNSDRYYALIQNRINTLTQEAKDKNLFPVFMTITLPSEYHKMKFNNRTKKLIPNPKYSYITPRESVKVLTKMFAKLRHDRSLKELSRDERIYFRVNEPHKNGTPHTHVLLFLPKERVERVVTAFKRLFNSKANDIQTNINNATAYVMKYINKTLPLSKKANLSEKEKYLNAWYSRHRITRFNSSKTLAPLKLYRLLYEKYTLGQLTKLVHTKKLKIFVPIDDMQKIIEVFDGDELVYRRSDNFIVGSGL